MGSVGSPVGRTGWAERLPWVGGDVEDSGRLNQVNGYLLKAILDAGQQRVVVGW